MKNRKIKKLLELVKKEELKIQELTDEQLKNKTIEFQERLKLNEDLDALLPEAFAVVCEADKRVLGMHPYDVQIMGAIALHLCYLAEMNTGEGKTLTATMPLYLNALDKKGAILVTANEYLAERDAKEMGPVFEFLGLSCCAGVSSTEEITLTNDQKREIYNHDIVYTTHSVLGFDYLLNNLVSSANDRFIRDFNYVIVDEADLVLLDAANMPLVISGSPRVQSNLYEMANFFVTTLKAEEDYLLEDKKTWLTKQGIEKAQRFFRIDNFYAHEYFEINRHVVLALRAHVLFKKEKDYVVSKEGEIVLLDNESGRMLPGMKMRGGQHQALEVKERIELTNENRSVASITYQNLFQLFPKMSGMSGTISDAKEELLHVYHKKVVVIPPNKQILRVDLPDKYYKDSENQFKDAIQDVILRNKVKQPVLVVTSTIADTDYVSKVLMQEKISHNVLNANNAYWEADMIKEAGQIGAVTVSTGMAGRGTDIHLGRGVKEIGGLAVIGIGRMLNTRLERQIRGRAGRQGDPGCSQFYVSLEDEVVSSINEDLIEKYIDRNEEISLNKLKKIINHSQKLSEENAQRQRKNAYEYDSVLLKQRSIIYDIRNHLLDGKSIEDEKLLAIAKENINNTFHNKYNQKDINRYVLDNISYELKCIDASKDVENKLLECINEALQTKKKEFENKEIHNEYIRKCALQAVDSAWIEEVDYLQQLQYAVSGRTSAQRNTLFEYQQEAYQSYRMMEKQIKKDMIRNILLSEVLFDRNGEMNIIYP